MDSKPAEGFWGEVEWELDENDPNGDLNKVDVVGLVDTSKIWI